jgi:hypothetical protein
MGVVVDKYVRWFDIVVTVACVVESAHILK